ncbi:ABC transporter permease subunit [Thalassotalea sp. M1531]|uniref:ABC transporter permease subunit n=1 Tax=Thalassotalea algicola TaxID=2716224 RepID=A0A7Y0Q747_9GAMM|nr:ABC transporter permease subunit [Thalassotalea algicola]NMP30665.1 ABC transporter permease subunit [Thalassotalea algicola]
MQSSTIDTVRQPTSISRIWTIANYELTRLFNTKRGWMALIAFAIVWYFILRYPVYYASSIISQPQLEDTLKQVFGMVGVENLLAWPVPELAVYWVTSLILYPLFALLITSDQISSDKARGTLRFIVLRTTRFELFFGRYLGQLLILTILILATLLAASAMAIYRDPVLSSSFASHFGFILFHMLFVLAPVVAVTALTSVVCQSARSATFLAIIGIGFSIILVAVVSYYIPQLSLLSDVLLGAQVTDLATSSGMDSMSYLILPISQTVVILIIAMFLFNRRAL